MNRLTVSATRSRARLMISGKPSAQQGTALITVLLIFFVASFITSEILDRADRMIRRTAHLIAQDQAYVYALSAEQLAIQLLQEDLKEDRQANEDGQIIDDLSEFWTEKVWFPLPGGGISAELKDAQSRFNLNHFQSDVNHATQFLRRYLEEQAVFTDLQEQEIFLASLADWVDPNEEVEGEGAEDYYYLGLGEWPYRSANHAFVSTSELNFVRSMVPSLYAQIAPLVAVLPSNAKLNINTLDSGLVSHIPGVSDPEDVLEGREESGYITVAEAFDGQTEPEDPRETDDIQDNDSLDEQDESSETGRSDRKINKVSQDLFSVHTEYFELAVDVTIDERQVRMMSLVFRPMEPSEEDPIRVIRRSKLNYYAPAAVNKNQ